MIKAKVLAIEEYSELALLERLFLNHPEYQFDSLQDLSDDGFYRTEIPRDYDLYWMHLGGVEWDAIRSIKENQTWSKIVLRESIRDSSASRERLAGEIYVLAHGADAIIGHNEGNDQLVVLRTLRRFGINLRGS
ncbi:MAG: hypothetical protein Q8P81_02815 [Nanoarchaeota archaeon]|nr:hypothetical protein [Nanoarchaeota archaeon]